eukprot:scaffold1214_cov311-Pavlova_lutheri.AAC.1
MISIFPPLYRYLSSSTSIPRPIHRIFASIRPRGWGDRKRTARVVRRPPGPRIEISEDDLGEGAGEAATTCFALRSTSNDRRAARAALPFVEHGAPERPPGGAMGQREPTLGWRGGDAARAGCGDACIRGVRAGFGVAATDRDGTGHGGRHAAAHRQDEGRRKGDG